MPIIHDRIEENLIKTLRHHNALEHSGHCLHIRGQALNQSDFESLPDLIVGWVGEVDSQIYICHDLDVFVFSSTLSIDVFAKLKDHFQMQFDHQIQGKEKILSFYDIGHSGLGLIELAEIKLAKKKELLKKVTAKRHEDMQQGQRVDFLKMPLNPDLISTLNKRRQARHKPQIMVVEDDLFSRKLIDTSLSGFLVSYAENGYEAMITYVQKAPDIIFLDIGLPDVNGHDILCKIMSFDPKAYVVMLSGNSHSENITAAINAGAKGFIGKPFTKDKLLQYIGKYHKHV